MIASSTPSFCLNMGGSDGKETKQLFSVLGEIVPYKKFKKRGGEPFFTCVLRGANHFLHVFQGGEKIFNDNF